VALVGTSEIGVFKLRDAQQSLLFPSSSAQSSFELSILPGFNTSDHRLYDLTASHFLQKKRH